MDVGAVNGEGGRYLAVWFHHDPQLFHKGTWVRSVP